MAKSPGMSPVAVLSFSSVASHVSFKDKGTYSTVQYTEYSTVHIIHAVLRIHGISARIRVLYPIALTFRLSIGILPKLLQQLIFVRGQLSNSKLKKDINSNRSQLKKIERQIKKFN